MTDAQERWTKKDIIQIIVPLILLLNTLISLFAAHRINQVELATNSMKDALVKVTGESEYAKGLLKGKQGKQEK